MTKEDLQPFLAQATAELSALYRAGEPASRFLFRTTSGTTGMPLVRLDRLPPHSARGAASRRFLIVTNAPTVQLSNALAHVCGGEGELLALDSHDFSETLPLLLADFAPECVIGLPSFLVRLPPFLNQVRDVVPIGERADPEALARIRTLFPQASIRMEYVNAELGKLGASCEQLPPNRYHPWKQTIISIDPDAGELVVSRSLSPHVYVEGYKTGDAGRMVPGRCSCGEEITFEVLGRLGYDYLKLSGFQLHVQEFERVMRELSHYASDFRALVSREEDRWRIALQIVPRGQLLRDHSHRDLFAREFERALFVAPSKTLAEAIEADAFAPLTLMLSAPFVEEGKVLKLRMQSSPGAEKPLV